MMAGLRVVVTRAEEQADSLVGALELRGAQVAAVPVIRFAPPDDGGAALQSGLVQLETYDWLLMTSTNTVERVAEALAPQRRPLIPTAAIGARTAAAASEAGFDVQLVPDEFVGEGLLAVMPRPQSSGGRVLLPRAAIGRQALLDGLRDLGWEVSLVETYRTLPVTDFTPEQRSQAGDADVVTFTSPSTVSAYIEAFGAELPAVASIGPVTTAAVEAAGCAVEVEANPHTIDGLVDAIEQRWGTDGV